MPKIGCWGYLFGTLTIVMVAGLVECINIGERCADTLKSASFTTLLFFALFIFSAVVHSRSLQVKQEREEEREKRIKEYDKKKSTSNFENKDEDANSGDESLLIYGHFESQEEYFEHEEEKEARREERSNDDRFWWNT